MELFFILALRLIKCLGLSFMHGQICDDQLFRRTITVLRQEIKEWLVNNLLLDYNKESQKKVSLVFK